MSDNTIIFLNSSNRLTGSIHDFTINFNDLLIKAPKNHYIQMNVEQVSINRSWFTIQNGFNTFTLTNNLNNNTLITITEGYYNALDLRTTLQSQLPQFTVTYEKLTNKFIFQCNDFTGITNRRFIFNNNTIASLLGFNKDETPTFTPASLPGTSINNTIKSSKPIKVNEDACIYIRSDINKQSLASLENIGLDIKESDIICSIPVEAAPFDNVIYNRNNNSNFTFNILTPSINKVRFYITNELGVPLIIPYDYSFALSFKYIPYDTTNNKTIKLLNDIKDYIKLYLLHDKKIMSS